MFKDLSPGDAFAFTFCGIVASAIVGAAIFFSVAGYHGYTHHKNRVQTCDKIVTTIANDMSEVALSRYDNLADWYTMMCTRRYKQLIVDTNQPLLTPYIVAEEGAGT